MYSIYSLPPELQLKIVKEMTTEALFNLVTEASPNANGIPRVLLDQSRIELFKRRGEKAEKFQYMLLGSWLKHWNINQKLSFIKSDENVEEWISLLQNAISDPEIAIDGKCRYSLLIDKLIGAPDEITPKITQSIMSDFDKHKVSSKLDQVITEISPEDESLLIKAIPSLLKSIDSQIRLSAIDMLKRLGSLASPKIREHIITLLYSIREEREWDVICAQIDSIDALLNFSGNTQKESIHVLLLAYSNHEHHLVRDAAITCMVEISKTATQDQISKMVNAILRIIDDKNVFATESQSMKDFVRFNAIKILSEIGIHLKENDPIITALIRYLSFKDDTVILNAAQSLAKLKPYTSQSKKEEIHNLLNKWVYDPECNDYKNLMPLITYASQSEMDEITNYIISKKEIHRMSSHVRNSAIYSLGIIYKNIKGPSRNRIITAITGWLEDVKSKETALQVLSNLIQDANPEQRNIIITAVAKTLKDNELLGKLAFEQPHQLPLFANYMSLSELESLSKQMIARIESQRSFVISYLLMSLVKILKYLGQSTCQEHIEKLLSAVARNNNVTAFLGYNIYEQVASLGSVFHLATNIQQEKIFTLLIKAVERKYTQGQHDSIANTIASKIEYFTSDQLNRIIQLNDDEETRAIPLKLLAQTQINLNDYRQIDPLLDDPTVDVKRLFGNK